MTICDCCHREVDYVRHSMWHGHAAICLACFYVWYDCGDEISSDPVKIKAYVLRAHASGEWPFTADLERARRR
jgi:hypothetical protein